MIDNILQKQISNKVSAGDTSSNNSPLREFQSAKDEGEEEPQDKTGTPSDIDNDRISEEDKEADEFYDCVEDYKGIEILKMHEIEEQDEPEEEKPHGLRRTASFTNV